MLEVEDKSPITMGQHVTVKLCSSSANAREALSKHEGGATTEQQASL